MMQKKLVRVFALALCICLLAGCQQGGVTTAPTTTAATEPKEVLYTIAVSTSFGTVPAGLEFYVYKSAELVGVVKYGTLTTGGKIEFTAPASDGYTLVLKGWEGVPGMAEGYKIEEQYAISGEKTEIVLQAGLVMGADAAAKRYQLGDMMRDFSITDTDGNVHTISELLKTKKAVVLNFWNIKCDPCKSEFPYLQKAYEAYSDDIALLAIDPIGSDSMDKIADFKQTHGLSFPMAPCDPAWINAIAPANPTTVIIDRYGRICVKETGAIPEEGIFEAVFAHFVAEDYEQIMISDMQEFAAEANS